MNLKASLAPIPQSIVETAASLTLPRHLQIGVAESKDEILGPARGLRDALAQHGVAGEILPLASRPDSLVRLAIEPSHLPNPESYELVADASGVSLTGADGAGLFYAAVTLRQILELVTESGEPPALPGLQITDAPDFLHRGVLLDISRDRVPTMETLLDLTDLLASWKINQLQLYMEHTFAYRGHERVWEGADPFTPDEIRTLDDFCRARHIELVPNQNSFGHMHRWLKHEPYRRLAECPEGIRHPFGHAPEPFSLCPTDPASLDLLADLYDQLLPNFSSRQFNVGLDETLDLGLGRSAEACKRGGKGRTYLEFLKKIHRLVSERGRRMQFWGDMMRGYPHLAADLPRDVLPLEWGYEANHPFEENVRLFGQAGLSFYVCPGTSSWNSLSGRTDNALANLKTAASAGHAAGAVGYLITDWGDNGHMQPPPVSYLGLLAGACCAWNVKSSTRLDGATLPRLLDAHAFRDRAGRMGRIAFDLGNVYRAMGDHTRNGTVLFRLLTDPDIPLDALPSRGLAEAQDEELIDGIMQGISETRMQRSDASLTKREFNWVADAMKLACRLWPSRAGEPPTLGRGELARELQRLIAEHRHLWIRRSRPGGLDDSCSRLERTLTSLMG